MISKASNNYGLHQFTKKLISLIINDIMIKTITSE